MSLSRPNVDCLMGEWRRPHNDLQEQVVGGGHKAIHDDATAQSVGFSGAPIHGTVHWSQFTPLFLQAFGKEWFETGSISVHFKTMVLHMQPVRAFMARPDPSKKAQVVDIWMEHVDGRVVFEGTASVGLKPDQMTTKVAQQLAGIKPLKAPLLFERKALGTKTTNKEPMSIGWEGPVHPQSFPFTLERKLEIITEYHPWFSKEFGKSSPWGRPVLPPECLNAMMLTGKEPQRWPQVPGEEWLAKAMGGRSPVGLFGACEVVLHGGPVFPDEDYELSRELVGKGETPRAEFNWVRTYLTEKKSGKLVAEMTLQSMMMKAGFEGYQELREKAAAPAAKL